MLGEMALTGCVALHNLQVSTCLLKMNSGCEAAGRIPGPAFPLQQKVKRKQVTFKFFPSPPSFPLTPRSPSEAFSAARSCSHLESVLHQGQRGRGCYRQRPGEARLFCSGPKAANLVAVLNLTFESSLGVLKTPREYRLPEQIHLRACPTRLLLKAVHVDSVTSHLCSVLPRCELTGRQF